MGLECKSEETWKRRPRACAKAFSFVSTLASDDFICCTFQLALLSRAQDIPSLHRRRFENETVFYTTRAQRENNSHIECVLSIITSKNNEKVPKCARMPVI